MKMGIAQPLQQVFHAPQIESAGIGVSRPPLVVSALQQEVDGVTIVHLTNCGYYILGSKS